MGGYRQHIISLRRTILLNPILSISTFMIIIAIALLIGYSLWNNTLNVQAALNGIGVIIALLAVLYSQSRFIQERRDPIKRDIMEMVNRWIQATEAQIEVLDGDIGWDNNLHLESGQFENVIAIDELEDVYFEYLRRNYPNFFTLVSDFEHHEKQVIETGNSASSSIRELVLRYMKGEFQTHLDSQDLSAASNLVTSHILNRSIPPVDKLIERFGMTEVQAGDLQHEIELVVESKQSRIFPRAYDEPPKDYQDYIQALREMEEYYVDLMEELEEIRYDLARQGIEFN